MSKNKIINKLRNINEDLPSSEDMRTNFKKTTDTMSNVVKTELGTDDEETKDIVSGILKSGISEVKDNSDFNPVVQYHSDRTDETPFMINGTKWQYVNAIYPNGKKDIAVYRYGHDLAYDYKWFMDNIVGKLKNAGDVTEVNQEDFHTEGEDASVGRGIETGMNSEVEADKYEEYRALMTQLAAEEGDQEQPVKEADGQGNDPVKLKADVEKLMAKLDISSIAPYLAKIDNPVEQAEVIGQFAEKIGVPKTKLSAVVAQLKTVAENVNPKMTKNQLVEAVIGRKVVKTIKVKDIK
jgi:nucleoid DNA-binding protein